MQKTNTNNNRLQKKNYNKNPDTNVSGFKIDLATTYSPTF